MACGAIFHTAYARMTGAEVPASCPRCGKEEVPDWMHIAWSCEAMEGRRPVQPRSPWQARPAWPITGKIKYD